MHGMRHTAPSNNNSPFKWWFLLVAPLWSTTAQSSQSTRDGWQSAQNRVATFSSQSPHIRCLCGALLPTFPAPLTLLPLLLALFLPPLLWSYENKWGTYTNASKIVTWQNFFPPFHMEKMFLLQLYLPLNCTHNLSISF